MLMNARITKNPPTMIRLGPSPLNKKMDLVAKSFKYYLTNISPITSFVKVRYKFEGLQKRLVTWKNFEGN